MRPHDHASERTRPPYAEQMAGTMLDYLPVGSQPVDTSEEAADLMFRSGKAAERRWHVLERLERGPVTADGFLAELAEQLGVEPRANSWAPRFTELASVGAATYAGVSVKTRSGGSAHPLVISQLRQSLLRNRRAVTQTAGGSFGPERKTAA